MRYEHHRFISILLASTSMFLIATGCADSPTTVNNTGYSRSPAGPATAGRDQAAQATGGEPAALAGITEAHNRVRARVGAPPLRWSPTLAEAARRWANSCVDVVAPRGMLDHSTGRSEGYAGPIGENIHATTAPAADPMVAVNDWAAEAVHYDYKQNTCSGGVCGHYTQVVWSTTREVGCGVGSCPRLKFHSTLVCNYAPAGNFIGQRPYP